MDGGVPWRPGLDPTTVCASGNHTDVMFRSGTSPPDFEGISKEPKGLGGFTDELPVRRGSALAVGDGTGVCLAERDSAAQSYADLAGVPYGPRYDTRVQRVQEEGPPPMPSAETPANPPVSEPVTENLALPAAEKPFGGGEPTTEVAATEAKKEEEKPEDKQRWLQKALGLGDSPVKIYGWIQNSFTANANGTGAHAANFGVNPNNQADRWMGNQYYTVIEKTLDQNDKINFGFRFDSLFGNDWSFNYMQGLLNKAFAPVGTFHGWDPAQFYAEVHLPDPTELTKGIDIKGGRWYTIAGYEVVPAIGRPLLSVPYMFNYGQPFTHMGFITTWHLTDKLNWYNGTINGWDRFCNEHYDWGYIGGFSYTFNEDKTSLAMTVVWGPNQFPKFLPSNQQIFPTGYVNVPSVAGLTNPGYDKNDRTLFTWVLTHKWNDKLTQVMETDQGWEKNVPGLGAVLNNGVPTSAAPKDESWFSFGNWFLYNCTDKLTAVWRSEVFWDLGGARTGLNDGTHFVGDRFYEQTLGLIYKPVPHFWIRPELRYDWTQFHPAYTDNTRNSQFTFGIDAILLY